jgi:hypothetical protein
MRQPDEISIALCAIAIGQLTIANNPSAKMIRVEEAVAFFTQGACPRIILLR